MGLSTGFICLIRRSADLIAVGLKLPEKVGSVRYESVLKLASPLLLVAVASAAHGWLENH